MQKIHQELEDRSIQEKTPEELGIQKYYVCADSGFLAKDGCRGQWEYAASESAPIMICNLPSEKSTCCTADAFSG